MATAQDIIDRALRLIGAIESGESGTSDESADGLEALNALIDSWRNDRLMVYARTEVSFAMIAGTSSYTVGSGGNFNTTRPVKIESAFHTKSNVNYPVELIDERKWYAIDDRTVTGEIVEKAWYNPTLSTGTLKVYPVPNATHTLTLVVWTPISTLATVGTSVTLPPGYERALAYNLAIELAPEFQVSARPEVVKIASDSLAALKRVNSRPIVATVDIPALVQPARGDIIAGI